jgi:hypothetical protein
MSEQKQFKHTVLQNKKNGTRFFTSYHTDIKTEWYDLVGHVYTVEDAQALTKVTEDKNIDYYMNSLPDELRDPRTDALIQSILRHG